MFYLVGLGNVGEEYRTTRHNVGWLMLDACVASLALPEPSYSAKYHGAYAQGVAEGQEIAVLYPHTYMNHSGSAVLKFVPKDPRSLIVIADDVDLPFGTIKVSYGRGHGGHNGIRSIIDTLGTRDFTRIRVGIAPSGFFGAFLRPSGDRLASYVLAPFSKKELASLPLVSEKVIHALHIILTEGKEAAMNACN